MASIIQIICIFICCVVIHSILHRLLLIFRKRSFVIVGIYGIGFVGSLWITVNKIEFIPIREFDLPVTSLVLFSLLSMLLIVIYLPIVVEGAQSPADIILRSLKKKPRTEKELFSLFSQKLLIERRIHDLVTYGFIHMSSKEHTSVTTKGKFLGYLIQFTIKLFGLPVGG